MERSVKHFTEGLKPVSSIPINPLPHMPLSIFQSPLTHATIIPPIPSHTCYNQPINPLPHMLHFTINPSIIFHTSYNQSSNSHPHFLQSVLQSLPQSFLISSHTRSYQAFNSLKKLATIKLSLPFHIYMLQSILQSPSYMLQTILQFLYQSSNPLSHMLQLILQSPSHTSYACYKQSYNSLPYIPLSILQFAPTHQSSPVPATSTPSPSTTTLR